MEAKRLTDICTRDNRIDAMKGIGIFLMVMLHAGGPFSHFINLFHMAVFFIASGYFWDKKNSCTLTVLKTYTLRKLRALLIPFVTFNGILIFLNNFFLKIGFYTNNKEFLQITSGASGSLQRRMSVWQMILEFAKTFVFAGKAPLASPTWFLGTLCITAILYAFVEFAGILTGKMKLLNIFMVISMGIGATIVSIFNIRTPNGIHTVFAAYLTYTMGVIIKKYDLMKKIKYKSCIVTASSFWLLYMLNNWGSVAFWSGSITNVPFFLSVSLLGWVLLWFAMDMVPRFLVNGMAYIGRHSMSVFLLHILCFKLVTLIYLSLTDGNPLLLASIPRLEKAPCYLWVVYTVVGITSPLILELAGKNGVDH